jgi:signal recognition particle subunit SRP54
MARDFTLIDFRRQLEQVEKSGTKAPFGRFPGLWALQGGGESQDAVFRRIRRVVDAMTDEERTNPDRIDDAGMSLIAGRAGTQREDVARVLAQFYQVREFMRQAAGMSLWKRIKMVLGFERVPGRDARAERAAAPGPVRESDSGGS